MGFKVMWKREKNIVDHAPTAKDDFSAAYWESRDQGYRNRYNLIDRPSAKAAVIFVKWTKGSDFGTSEIFLSIR